MRKIIFIVLGTWLSLTAIAQNEWEIPNAQPQKSAPTKVEKQKPVEQKDNPDAPYLAGAVPEVDGIVTWNLHVDAPGKSAQELYDRMMEHFGKLTSGENQLEGSCVSLVNKQEHIIVVSLREWMVFRSSLLSLDRTKFFCKIVATCKDGAVDVVFDRLTYRYEEERSEGGQLYKAEEWISDRAALTKKGKMYRGCAKFRRKTVDRMNELMDGIRAAIDN